MSKGLGTAVGPETWAVVEKVFSQENVPDEILQEVMDDTFKRVGVVLGRDGNIGIIREDKKGAHHLSVASLRGENLFGGLILPSRQRSIGEVAEVIDWIQKEGDFTMFA